MSRLGCCRRSIASSGRWVKSASRILEGSTSPLSSLCAEAPSRLGASTLFPGLDDFALARGRDTREPADPVASQINNSHS